VQSQTKNIALVVLLLFSAYTAFSMWVAEESLFAFGARLLSSTDTAQVVIDLYIMATLAIVWMYRDARKRSSHTWYWLPFAVLTLVFVSAGPLLYLVLRPTDRSSDQNMEMRGGKNGVP